MMQHVYFMGWPPTDTCGFGMSHSLQTPLDNMTINPLRAFLSDIFRDRRMAFKAQMAKKYLEVAESG
jgi:hypothetical protein